MDTQTIDQEYEKLEGEFADLAKSVQGLVEKLQAAEKAADTNATEWLSDLKPIATQSDGSDLITPEDEGISFDGSVAGFAEKPNLLKLVFEPPFLPLTLCIVLPISTPRFIISPSGRTRQAAKLT